MYEIQPSFLSGADPNWLCSCANREIESTSSNQQCMPAKNSTADQKIFGCQCTFRMHIWGTSRLRETHPASSRMLVPHGVSAFAMPMQPSIHEPCVQRFTRHRPGIDTILWWLPPPQHNHGEQNYSKTVFVPAALMIFQCTVYRKECC